MGTMERMRRTSPYVLAAFAIIFVGFMVASDADMSNMMKSGDNFQTASIADVNGEKILYKDFEEKVREQVEQQRKQMQSQGNEQEVDDVQIRRSVWSEMLEEKLLNQVASEMGVTVTQEELLDVFFNNPPDFLRKPFTDSTGNFNMESYREIMRNPDVIFNRLPQNTPQEEKRRIVNSFRSDLLRIEKALKDEKLRNGLNSAINSALSVVSPLYAKEKFLADNSTADVSFIFLDAKEIAENSVTVKDEEIKTYYEKYKKLWPQKQKRKIKYVLFPLIPSASDSAVVTKAVIRIDTLIKRAGEDLNKSFTKKAEEFKGTVHDFTQLKDIPPQKLSILSTLSINQIVGPVQLQDGICYYRLDDRRSGENFVVKASHILIPFGANKDSAKAEAQKIFAETKTGDFAQLALKYSSDKGSAQNGGDVGFFGKGMMVKEFEEAAFAAKTGSIVGPVESQFGYHIIKVTDKQSDELKFTEIVLKPEISRMTIKGLGRDAKELKTRVDNGESFDAVAKFFNKTPRETEFFEKEKPVLGSQFIALKSFEMKIGEVLEPIEMKKNGIVVVQVKDQRTAGIVPFEDMKDKIKSNLLNAKKLDLLKIKAQELYAQVKSVGNLQNFQSPNPAIQVKNTAGVKNNGVVPGLGQDFGFTEKVFAAPLNQISEPIRGERGYYIIQVNNKVVPDANTSSKQMGEFLVQLRNNFKTGGYYQWFNKLKEDSDIEDHRTKFFNEF
jgi:peptidyl-prolyl cis-trans isomerase D